MAVDFELQDLDGNPVRLHSLAGKPVVLNFWASWCPPCRAEMPDMEALKAMLGDRVQFVGVNVGESAKEVRHFALENGLSWMFLTDSDGRVSDLYRVRSIPTSLFIDASGRIVARVVGKLGLEEMVALTKQAIDGKRNGGAMVSF